MTEKVRRLYQQVWFLLPFGGAFTLYLFTMAPGVVGFDSAELITGAFTLGIVHPSGYPLFLLLGKLFTFLPVGNVAYRLNVMSAFFAALAVCLMAILVYQWTGRRWVGIFSGMVLAGMISFWQMAVVTEVYSLHVFFLTLEMLLLLRWRQTEKIGWLDAFVFVYALSLTNHVSGVLFAPAFAWFVFKNAGWSALFRRVPLFFLFGMLGFSPYLYLPIRQMAQPSLDYVSSYYNIDLRTVSGLWWMISGQAYHFFAFSYNAAGYLREAGSFLNLLIRNVTIVGAALGIGGILVMIRKRLPMRFALLLLFLAYAFFYIGYGVVDKATMFLPVFAVWVIWMGIGLDGLVRIGQELLRRDFPHASPLRVEFLIQALTALFLTAILMSNWGWADMSEAYAPEIFAEQVLLTIEDEAFIMGEWSSAVILEYYQTVEGVRPDVEIFNRSRFQVAQYYQFLEQDESPSEAAAVVYALEEAWIAMVAKDRPVYAVEYDPRLASSYEYQPVGNIYQLVPRY